MPYLDRVIDYLNQHLQNTTLKRKDIQRGRFFGLAKQASIESEDGGTVPVIFSHGNEIDPIVDDKYTFQMYHRIMSTSYAVSDSIRAGDEFQFMDETTTVRAVVYSNASIKLSENDLSFLIMVGLTTVIGKEYISDLNISNVSVLPSGVDFNSKSVFQQEYGNNVEFKLNPADNFFAFTYTVRMTANKNCLSCIDC